MTNRLTAPQTPPRTRVLHDAPNCRVSVSAHETPFRGIVVHGKGKARTIGFPTANIPIPWEFSAPEGLYAATIRLPPGFKEPLRGAFAAVPARAPESMVRLHAYAKEMSPLFGGTPVALEPGWHRRPLPPCHGRRRLRRSLLSIPGRSHEV